MDSKNKYFERALGRLIRDTASGGAIRHLADLGYTVDEIHDRLDYPTPRAQIADVVFQHFVDSGVIRLEEPTGDAMIEKVSYVSKYNKYGKKTLRRVVEYVPPESKEFIRCDFGKRRYRDPAGFEASLARLTEGDRAYVSSLPWPLAPVWHRADERMLRIRDALDL